MTIATPWTRLTGGRWAGILASALLCHLYAWGGAGWLLGFVALAPWLRTLDGERKLAGSLLAACAMAAAYTAAVFWWFGAAIGSYTQAGSGAGLALLVLAAPLWQPQFLAFALVRHVVGRRHGPLPRALAGAAAWVAAEWCVPRLLGDTFGYGLYPSRLLRQGADVGGVAGLTVLLLLANEGVAAALARRQRGPRAWAGPLVLAALVPLLLAAYGLVALAAQPAAPARLRMGLVQSNVVDYERLRREHGVAAVVRGVLDIHFAMSYDAVERQGADAVLWSETVYPTTFGRPKSEAGAELDREILEVVNAAGVPFVFGTYDRDAAGEYNAAAFVAPGTGLLGMYRKTRPFPLTEYVPDALDGPALRRWLPWAGSWRPGTGARVFPLRLRDGREVPVLPLICLDDLDAGLAIEGARLGGQAILTLSNDAWFTGSGQGARLHQAAAAFRSIETRLPQFRVTPNGFTSVIDATGTVVAGAGRGERTLVMGEVPVGPAPRTLMLAWGDWVGRASAVLLALLALLSLAASARRGWGPRSGARPLARGAAVPCRLAVLPPAARLAAGLLRGFARGALLGMAGAAVFGDGVWPTSPLAQIRAFTALFLAPEAAAWCVLRAFAARAVLDEGVLVLTRGRQGLRLAVREVVAVQPWRLPLPGPGATLWLASGERWRHGLAMADPLAFARALRRAGGLAGQAMPPPRGSAYLRSRLALPRPRLGHPVLKFGLLPLLLALPAYRLHQHIAFGGAFGEYHLFGLLAYLKGLALWWASWAIGVMLVAAVLRGGIEAGSAAAARLRPGRALAARLCLERAGLGFLYLGLPAWLALRLLAP